MVQFELIIFQANQSLVKSSNCCLLHDCTIVFSKHKHQADNLQYYETLRIIANVYLSVLFPDQGIYKQWLAIIIIFLFVLPMY